ncbi:MAG TPA: carboxypeptidase-like regulatory domain-containing protein, partial [Candidatus Acidoferrum sp.]|nr:carboxypeptidase-like regulatory domain-containing protein [Candidatus Acidoferrum sp.]
MKKLLAALFVLALLLFYLASGSNAQTVQGVITGTVTDPSGAAVPGATITITHAGTGASLSTTTGTDGTYRFPLVPPGSYVISIKSANFKEVRTTGIVVEASQTVPFNARWEIG